MSNFYHEARSMVASSPGNVLNLAVPKYEASTPPMMEHPVPMIPSASFFCNNIFSLPQVRIFNN